MASVLISTVLISKLCFFCGLSYETPIVNGKWARISYFQLTFHWEPRWNSAKSQACFCVCWFIQSYLLIE